MLPFILSLLVACVAASTKDVCQSPGGAICKSVDLPDLQFEPCCAGSECRAWTGAGYVPNPEGPDFFCQSDDPIPAGGDCSAMQGDCEEVALLALYLRCFHGFGKTVTTFLYGDLFEPG